MRVVFWASVPLARREVIERLQTVPGAELTVVESLPDLLAALPGAEALVLYDAPEAKAREVVAALNAPGNTVRWMHFVSAGREGFEAVGLPAGVTVTYAAGGVAPTVAEHAMALVLALGRRVPAVLAQQAERKWSRAPSAQATSLEGGVMAIVGYGQIGRELARRARAFGMRVVAVSRTVKTDELLDECHPLAELHRVLATADVVVVAIALTAQTRHLFDRQALAACKPGALLVNVARGGVIDQAALAEALASGHLGGAGLDVTDPEPLPASDPLWDAPGLIITPHYAGGGSPVSMARLGDGVAANLQRLMAGEPLHDVVQG